MNAPSKLLFVLFTFMISVQQVAAEEWRGIVPLHSTREDVVRLVGECANTREFCEFTVPNEEILITFSTNRVCPEGMPINTVLMVQRELQTATTLAALGLDKRRFNSFDPSIPRNAGYRAFIDEKSGLLLKAFREEIFQINYIPNDKERQVCPSYYHKPRQFVEVFHEHFLRISPGCPETSLNAGQKVVIAAEYPRSGIRNWLTWQTTGGRIIEGQYTRKIVLDTSGFEGPAITVTLELRDAFYHAAVASCVLRFTPKLKN